MEICRVRSPLSVPLIVMVAAVLGCPRPLKVTAAALDVMGATLAGRPAHSHAVSFWQLARAVLLARLSPEVTVTRSAAAQAAT